MKNIDREALRPRLAEGARALAIALSDAQIDKLLDYLALLLKWNTVYNLTAVRDPSQMVTQHLLDSLSAVPAFEGARRVLDVGAGGGLPGIVLGIWAAEAQPDMRITMIDTVHKKTAFLTQVKGELNLANIEVQTGRVEQWKASCAFDVITSRAFAELADFVTWSAHLLADEGKFIALKGVMPEGEIKKLPEGWKATEVRALHVPELDAERHLVFIERGGA